MTEREAPQRGWGLNANSVGGLLGKIILLAVITAIAVWLAIPLIGTERWSLLILVIVTTVLLYVIFLQPWHIPIKYIIPGTIFLIAFQVIPVVFTASTALTNFGDGHRGTKDDAITSIESGSVQRVEGSAEYVLTIAAKADPTSGNLVYLLVDPATKVAQQGDEEGLTPFPDAVMNERGKITTAPQGLVLLTASQAAARSAELETFAVPTENGAIKSQGLSRAYEGRPTRVYDAACDCITGQVSGEVWTADNNVGSFIDPSGKALPQGWQVNVGLSNFTRAFTDPAVSGPFLSILVWNFAFAFLSVLITFVAGLLVAMALNSPDLRALRFYRVLIVLPFAMPSFAMLLVWRDMFNQDFGLINGLTGQSINWFGQVWTARFAIMIVLFCVCGPRSSTTGSSDRPDTSMSSGSSTWAAMAASLRVEVSVRITSAAAGASAVVAARPMATKVAPAAMRPRRGRRTPCGASGLGGRSFERPFRDASIFDPSNGVVLTPPSFLRECDHE